MLSSSISTQQSYVTASVQQPQNPSLEQKNMEQHSAESHVNQSQHSHTPSPNQGNNLKTLLTMILGGLSEIMNNGSQSGTASSNINRKSHAKRGHITESNSKFHEPENIEYLTENFDPWTLTVPYCRKLLAKHGIRTKSSITKDEVGEKWIEELRPRMVEERAKVKRTAENDRSLPVELPSTTSSNIQRTAVATEVKSMLRDRKQWPAMSSKADADASTVQKSRVLEALSTAERYSSTDDKTTRTSPTKSTGSGPESDGDLQYPGLTRYLLYTADGHPVRAFITMAQAAAIAQSATKAETKPNASSSATRIAGISACEGPIRVTQQNGGNPRALQQSRSSGNTNTRSTRFNLLHRHETDAIQDLHDVELVDGNPWADTE